ncbi:uncharacterized protein BJ212DRAFT_1302644 [Suillus subaureus]|uniref:Uncharacterized protein n=1 Tax=Suillus subaureus TaxID=48587 RepID=A0A9P7E2T5_9AGAM|nr:uncharacterized protein BJ212DRAFT_1302644 [Suillus subaureus]KAG1809439.1 hypothetical protein BJ212DRAFT_1302644 [Suillus subaureus]
MAKARTRDTHPACITCTSCDVYMCSSMVRGASFPSVLQAFAPHTKDTAPVHTMGMEDAQDHGTVDSSIVTVIVPATRTILMGYGRSQYIVHVSVGFLVVVTTSLPTTSKTNYRLASGTSA